MVTKILTIEDVKLFAKQIIAEGVSFHPDEDFNDYVNVNDSKPYYSKVDADIRNAQMNNCFEVCEKAGVDVYDLMLEVVLVETSMDSYIPLPSMTFSEKR
jgi:hypothetical protein